MLSFFSEPALKRAVRCRVAEHRRLDQIVQRTYWQDGKGCFIGCSLHSSEHAAFERLLGLPQWLARLGERIFEGLQRAEAVDFPLALYDSIPVGADLEPVKARFLSWLILDPEHGVARLNPDLRVRHVGELWACVARGGQVSREEWAAADAAAEAAMDAAKAAAEAAAWAAMAAFRAASMAAEAASWAAAWAANAASWAAGAAGAAAYRVQAAKLIALMREAAPAIAPAPALPESEDFARYYAQVRMEAKR